MLYEVALIELIELGGGKNQKANLLLGLGKFTEQMGVQTLP
jgi:hypothetical protein